jgi:hypothetical protein
VSKHKEVKEPIDPYTGKPSIFLPTDSLVQRAEKGDKGARALVDSMGCAAMLLLVVSLGVCSVCLYKITIGITTGVW